MPSKPRSVFSPILFDTSFVNKVAGFGTLHHIRRHVPYDIANAAVIQLDQIICYAVTILGAGSLFCTTMSYGLSDGCLEKRIPCFEISTEGANINKAVSILLDKLVQKEVSRAKRPAARVTRLLSVPVYGQTANKEKKSFKGNEISPDMFLVESEHFPFLQHRHYLGADIERVQHLAKDRAFEEIKAIAYPIYVFIFVPDNQ